MQNRKALGRGLDVLIPKTEVNKNFAVPNLVERVKTVPIDSIVPNRLQPRKIFDEEKIKDLAASIKEQGIIQPLIVTQASPNRYELIAGERRLRAAKTAGLAEVPVVIKNVDTESMLELSLIETQASPNRYELIAGERRLRAAKTAGLAEVPVVIKNVDTESMLELSLIE